MSFAYQKIMVLTLPADGCALDFFGTRNPDPFPVTTLNLVLSFIHLIMSQSFNHCYQAQIKIILRPKTLQHSVTYWCFGCQLLIAKDFADLKGVLSCACSLIKVKIRLLKRYPCEIPYCLLYIPLSEYTRSRTFFSIFGIEWTPKTDFTFYRVWIFQLRI